MGDTNFLRNVSVPTVTLPQEMGGPLSYSVYPFMFLMMKSVE